MVQFKLTTYDKSLQYFITLKPMKCLSLFSSGGSFHILANTFMVLSTIFHRFLEECLINSFYWDLRINKSSTVYIITEGIISKHQYSPYGLVFGLLLLILLVCTLLLLWPSSPSWKAWMRSEVSLRMAFFSLPPAFPRHYHYYSGGPAHWHYLPCKSKKKEGWLSTHLPAQDLVNGGRLP